MIIRIAVTQDDIDKGSAGDSCRCPIARAIARAMPWLRGSDPEPFYVRANFLDLAAVYGNRVASLPPSVRGFITRYDDGLPVGPFEFDLDIPDHLVPAEVTK